MGKNSFIIYLDQYESIRTLTVVQKAQLLDAMYLFHLDEQLPDMDPVVVMAFSFMRRTFERDSVKYLEKCKKNRENVLKRWNKKNTTVCDRIRSDTKHTDTDSDTDSDTLSTDDSNEPSGNRPSRCSTEDWGKYLSYSRDFLERQEERLGALVKKTESKVITGAKALDNLIRVQGFEKKTVYETIEWAIYDDFWGAQLRSLGSLTKKGRNDETKFSNILAKRFEEVQRAERNAV